jgi:hypothetical protein
MYVTLVDPEQAPYIPSGLAHVLFLLSPYFFFLQEQNVAAVAFLSFFSPPTPPSPRHCHRWPEPPLPPAVVVALAPPRAPRPARATVSIGRLPPRLSL